MPAFDPVPGARERRIPLAEGDGLWAYERPGPTADAPAVLLVHGLGVTAHLTWRPSYAALAEHFRIVSLDLPGHGRGPRPPRFRLETCADDAMRVANALGIERCVLVGYSLGGPIAKLAWRRHPERVAGLVLAATASELARGRRARLLRLLHPLAAVLVRARPDAVHERLIERAIFRLDGTLDPAFVRAELAGHHLPTVLQAVCAAGSFSSRAWLSEIDVPVSVLVTSEDDRVAPARQRALAAAIQGARIFEAPGPHTACVTRAETFAPRLVESCLHVWRRASAGVRPASVSS